MTDIKRAVEAIIREVRSRGDAALCDFARRFDSVRMKPKQIVVSKRELQAAMGQVSPAFVRALREAGRRIESFARHEKRHLLKDWTADEKGVRVGQVVRPMDSAGLYIPGGRFAYPSTVLMTALPAQVAGVRRIALASPARNLTPEVLAAAAYAGCTTIYRLGGAGAIAALAYGTETVEKVDFIVGPGNQYVTEAKRQIYGQAGIDSLAGPSEVVIIADAHTPATFIEADLLAQAEHDPEARAILLCTDRRLIRRVAARMDSRIGGRISFRYVPSIEAAVEQANEIAPEHLELLFSQARRYLSRVRHAGAIFIGPATTAVLGDYVAGPSHVLPTQRAAHFSSGLSVASFLKRSSVIQFQARPRERRLWETAMTFAQTEGMEHHEKSLRARLSE
ncbi:MAG TPA: histidinol dehydrogenase [Elusimicrobiota bacterium]|nr:histidinol dehydrogenase [Elusimicrobiota bacterium]